MYQFWGKALRESHAVCQGTKSLSMHAHFLRSCQHVSNDMIVIDRPSKGASKTRLWHFLMDSMNQHEIPQAQIPESTWLVPPWCCWFVADPGRSVALCVVCFCYNLSLYGTFNAFPSLIPRSHRGPWLIRKHPKLWSVLVTLKPCSLKVHEDEQIRTENKSDSLGCQSQGRSLFAHFLSMK